MVFCDLVDSTAILTRLGDVAGEEFRRDVFAALREAVRVSGGTEVKNLGDGVMVAYPDMAGAVTGASALLVAASRVDAVWTDIEVALRVGCSAGAAMDDDGDWFGVPVVEAARLCAKAAAGEVLAAAHAFEDGHGVPPGAAQVAGLSLKGLPGSFRAYRWHPITPPAAGWVPPPAFDTALKDPLVGRHREMEALSTLAAGSREAGSPAAVVAGEAGSGKTRLLAEIAERIARDGGAVVGGNVTRNEPFQVLIDAIRSLLGRVKTSATGDLQPEQLATLAGVVVDGGEVVAARPAIVSLFAAVGLVRPVALLLDDGQHAAPALMEIVQDLVGLPQVFVAVGCRNDELATEALMGDIPHVVVGVGALSVDELASLLPEAPAEDRAMAVGLLLGESSGIPGRAVEIVRHMTAGDRRLPLVERVLRASARSCPYKGLSPYSSADADLFVGREDVIAHVFERLEERGIAVVVGASGSGKSSLVCAGVVPVIEAREDCSAVVLRPGPEPTMALSTALAAVDPAAVVVDQLEELFTLCGDLTVRNEFLGALGDLSSRCPVIVTIRGDMYARLAEHEDFARAAERSTVLVPPITKEEMRRIAERPADAAGLRFESGLVDRILADVGSDSGALPLLSHALLETWRRRRGSQMTAAAYEAAGTARGAIARTAEAVWESLDGASRESAQRIFLSLVEVHGGAEDTRRTVSREALTARGDPAAITSVLDRLVQARLVVIDDDGSTTIAHEALIRNWPRLRAWISEGRRAIEVERHLEAAAAEWDRQGRAATDLYRGQRLLAVQSWLTSSERQLAPLEVEFLEASQGAADRELARERSISRRLRRLLAVAVATALVAVAAGYSAVDRAGQARARARESDAAAQLSFVQRLAAQGQASAIAAPALARNLAVEAFRRRPDLPEVQSALLAVLMADPTYLGSLGTSTPTHALAADDRHVVVGTDLGVEVWELTSRTLERTLPIGAGDDLYSAALAGDRLITVSAAGVVSQWDIATGARIGVAVQTGVFAPDLFVDASRSRVVLSGDRVALVDLGASAVVPDAVTSEDDAPRRNRPVARVALSPNGRHAVEVVAVPGGYLAQLRSPFDLSPTAPPAQLAFPGWFRGIALDDAGAHLAIVDPAGSAAVFNLTTGRAVALDTTGETVQFGHVRQSDVAVVAGHNGVAVIDRATGRTTQRVDTSPPRDTSPVVVGGLLVVASAPPTVWSIDGSGALWPAPVDLAGEVVSEPPDLSTMVYVTRPPDAAGPSESSSSSSVRDLRSGAVRTRVEGAARIVAPGRMSIVQDSTVRITDLDGVDVAPPYAIPVPNGTVRARISPDLRWLAWSSALDGYDGIHVADLAERADAFDVELRPSEPMRRTPIVEQFEFSPDAARLAAVANGRYVAVDLRDGSRERTETTALGVAWSRDSRDAFLSHPDGVSLVDGVTGVRRPSEFGDKTALLYGMSVSADRRLLAATGTHVQLYASPSGVAIGPPIDVLGGVAVFGEDDELLLSTAAGLTRLATDPAAWSQRACASSGSNPSRREWKKYFGSAPYRLTCPGLPVRS